MKGKIRKILIFINCWKVVLLIFLVGLGLFYWFQARPSQICSACHQEAVNTAIELLRKKSELEDVSKYEEVAEKGIYLKDDYDYAYKQCLRKKGINK